MQNLNSILLEGNLLSDSRLVVTAPEGENWKSMVRFDLASHRVYRNSQGEQKDEVLIIACLAFGDLAERVLPILKSGMQVRVLGRLRCSKWTTKEGEERKSFEIVAQHVEFRRKKKGRKSEEEEVTLSDEGMSGESVSDSIFRYEFY